MKKKIPLLPTTLIYRFERRGTFKGGGGKNPLLSMTLGRFAKKQLYDNIYIFKKDHGVDVSIIIII
jgi:hypothetical protein